MFNTIPNLKILLVFNIRISESVRMLDLATPPAPPRTILDRSHPLTFFEFTSQTVQGALGFLVALSWCVPVATQLAQTQRQSSWTGLPCACLLVCWPHQNRIRSRTPEMSWLRPWKSQQHAPEQSRPTPHWHGSWSLASLSTQQRDTCKLLFWVFAATASEYLDSVVLVNTLCALSVLEAMTFCWPTH